MERRYDADRIYAIRSLIKNFSMNEALRDLETYIQDYPNDFGSNIMYAHALTRIGKFEEAENVINSIIIDSHTPENYQRRINLIKLYLHSYQHHYGKAYRFLKKEVFDFSSSLSYRFLTLYFEEKLHIPHKPSFIDEFYLAQQITSYNDKASLEHIRAHILGTQECKNSLSSLENQNKIYDSSGFFKEDFPYEDVFKKIKSILPTTPSLYRQGMENNYFCKYKRNGIVNNRETDYFVVAAFDGTDKIITMYPCSKASKMPYIDLTSSLEEVTDTDNKVKKLSQIEKFNQKYGNFNKN